MGVSFEVRAQLGSHQGVTSLFRVRNFFLFRFVWRGLCTGLSTRVGALSSSRLSAFLPALLRDHVPLPALLNALAEPFLLHRLEEPAERREPVLALVEV